MNFRPELAAKVMSGEKTVTRRLCSENERSPWFTDRCKLQVGQHYAVCPGRGKRAIGRVRIVNVRRERLSAVDHADAAREGFSGRVRFLVAFFEINPRANLDDFVWRIEFEVVA